MRTEASTLLLLLACCLWADEAQSNNYRRQNIWDEPIKFNTKANDLCTMIITGHGEYTRLRLSCQSSKRSYWCDYEGKPYTCRSYNKNPRHYFVQMMWDFRKLHNACQGQRQILPHMCRMATNDSQMVFSTASFSRSEDSSRTVARPVVRPWRPQPQPAPTSPVSVRTKQISMKSFHDTPRVKTTQRTTPQPPTPPGESNAKRMARQYCWKSLHGLCAFFIGLVKN